MEIHNIMEDKVLAIVNEICDDDEKTGSHNYCTSLQCRLDAACFVLNRIPQKYMTSGRGLAYLESDFYNDLQTQADIVALVHEGLRRVSEVRRSFYEDQLSEAPEEGYYFNFPMIRGRLINGLSFEPISGVEISFLLNGKEVDMIDSRWPNPYKLVENTNGTYIFWPKSVPAEKNGISQDFSFEIKIDDPHYEAFYHYFDISLQSEAIGISGIRNAKEFNLSDLFLVPN